MMMVISQWWWWWYHNDDDADGIIPSFEELQPQQNWKKSHNKGDVASEPLKQIYFDIDWVTHWRIWVPLIWAPDWGKSDQRKDKVIQWERWKVSLISIIKSISSVMETVCNRSKIHIHLSFVHNLFNVSPLCTHANSVLTFSLLF